MGKGVVGTIIGSIMSILLPILIIVIIASLLFAIFDAIIQFIMDIVLDILGGVLDFLAHPIESTIKGLYELHNARQKYRNGEFDGTGLEINQENQIVIISQENFNSMKAELEKITSTNAAGLDNIMLKKLLLAYNMENYSTDTDILIEITDEDITELDITDFVESCKPFSIKKGKEFEQLNVNVIQEAGNAIIGFVDESKIDQEIASKQGLQEKKYMYSKGILEFENDDGEKLQYFSSSVLQELYEKEFKANVDTEYNDYAESVWEYLNKCYTDGVNGMGMYSYEKVEETMTEWNFEDDDLITVDINRHFNVNINRQRTLQNIEYYSLVSEYSTPMEFMTALLEISSSKEFLNAFIDKIANDTRIKLKVYKTGYSYSELLQEETQEATKIKAKIKTDAEVLRQYDEENEEWIDGQGDIQVKGSIDSVVDGLYIKRKIKFKNVDDDISELKIRVPGESEYLTYIVKRDKDDNFIWEDGEAFLKEYDTKTNKCVLKKSTIQLNTETKYDIAIEEVKTWYGNITYHNEKKTNIKYETMLENGDLIELDAPEPRMIEYDQEDKIYEKSDENKETIFKENLIQTITAQEIGNQVEKWFANLTSDSLAYYVAGGKLTRALYEKLDGNEYAIITEDEAINIKLTYAMQEGLFDWYFLHNYSPIKITCESEKYYKGKLHTSINTYLDRESPPIVEENYDLFLSLLKTSDGKYKQEDSTGETYDPNGKEVTYKDIDGRKIRAAKLLLSGEEMLYELLEKSPNTQRLAIIMKEIFIKYKTGAPSSSMELSDLFNSKKMQDTFTIIGETTEEKIWCSLTNLGLSKESVAGIMGNIYADCEFDDTKIQDSTKESVGLGQWSGVRKTALTNYAKAKEVLESDINTQIQYLIGEITEGGGCNGYAIYQLQNVTYSGVTYTINNWKEAATPEEAAEQFAYIFKKPDGILSDIDVRKNKAKEYYEKYKDETIETISGTNQVQLDIAEIAQTSTDYGIVAQKGYCLGWVNDVYEAAGANTERKDCAYCSGYYFGVSTNFDNIPIGAAVYGESSTDAGKIYGHVGIYIGDGKVADNIGYVRITTLENWLDEYPNGCWGWTSGTPININYPVTQGLIHAGLHD